MVTRIEQAAAAVDAARALVAGSEHLTLAPDDEVVELLARTAELSRLVEAQQLRLVAELAERSKGPADDSLCRRLGQRSAKSAVASAFGVRGSQASALLSLAAATTATIGLSGGELPARYPRVADAVAQGHLSIAQAQAIVQTLEPAAPRADLGDLAWAEAALVDAATDPRAPLVPELITVQARAFAAVLDPDGVLPDAERQRSMRSLRMHKRPDGMWQLTMLCPPEQGSAIKALLDAHAGPRVRVAFRDAAEWNGADSIGSTDGDGAGVDGTDGDGAGVDGASGDVAGAGDGDRDDLPRSGCVAGGDPDVEEAVDDRTPDQRRHDVIVGLVRAHAASGAAPTVGGEAPVLVLTGTIDAYDAYLQGTAHRERTLRIEHTGDLVPIETVDRLLCDALVQRAVVDADGHPLELGRSERLFTRAQRRALAARDKGCRVIGCSMPPAWCEAHHVVPWQADGPTDVDNGILLCSYHHHEVHAGRILVERAGPAPGAWRLASQLQTWRTSSAGPRPGSGMRAAADAPPSLAVRLSEPALSVRPARRASPSTAQAQRLGGAAAATPRAQRLGRAAAATRPTVERRLRRLLRDRHGPGPHLAARAALDLWPNPHIVLRT